MNQCPQSTEVSASAEAQEEIVDEKKLAKLQRIETERKELLNRVISGNILNLKDRVASILNMSIDARNSDIDLAWHYWKEFEPQIFKQEGVTRDLLIKLTKINSLSRIRAKIQNEYKMFQADEIVRKFRGVLEDKNKTEALEDKPKGMGTYTVFVDETGKTQDYISVGSLWVLKYGYQIYNSHKQLSQWKIENGIEHEFHFSELNKHRIEVFKEFFLKFLSLHPEVSFKTIVLSSKGLSNKNSAITDLTYHLMAKGVEHEDSSGRAPLPRQLTLIIDDEEEGSDQLKLENVKERLLSRNIEDLYLGKFEAVSSKDNFFIQVVDLFTGSINRKLHNPEGNKFKDDFANFILETLNFDINTIDRNNNQADNSKVFTLS